MIKKLALMILFLCGCIVQVSATEVDRILESEMQKQKIPGLSLAVVRDGVVVEAKGYGMANLELQVPVKAETIFQSGSVGKQFTAAGVMLLVEQGKLKLDDPVSQYFPGSPESWQKITIRNLLTHTSGIPDYTEKQVDFRKDYTEDDLLKVLQALPLDFQPGVKWSYSNSGYMLLGFLIHKVSGVFYGDFLQQNIFVPLKMSTTRIISEADIVPNRAAGYVIKDGELKNQEWVSPTLNTTADGALYLNVLDMAKWDQALYSGRILNKETWKTVWSPVVLNSGATYPYGFGWRLDYERGQHVIEHSGHWQGFSTVISRYVDSNLTVILMANLEDVDTLGLSHAAAGFILPALTNPRFMKPQTGKEADVRVEEFKKLFRELSDGKSTMLTPGFAATLDADSAKSLSALGAKAKSWDSRGCDPAPQGAELHGAALQSFCYFGLETDKGPNVFAVAYTPEGKIADFYAE